MADNKVAVEVRDLKKEDDDKFNKPG